MPGTSQTEHGMDLNAQNIGAFNNNAQPSHLNYYESCFFPFIPSQSKLAAVEAYLYLRSGNIPLLGSL